MQAVQQSIHFSPPEDISAESTDLDLTERAADGDEFAFECIMRRHNRLLFRTARSILKSDADTEEASQEAYLLAWRALPTFRAGAKLSTWLVRIVIDEAPGRVRRGRAEVIPLDSAMGSADPLTQESFEDDADLQPERAAMRSEVRRLMEARIGSLPEAFRTVFELRAVEELSVEEASAALHVSEATVRTRFFRARRLLREGLSRDIDLAMDDAFSFAGARCDRIVAGVMTSLAEHRDSAPSSF